MYLLMMTEAGQDSYQYRARMHSCGFEESGDVGMMVVLKQRPHDPGIRYHDNMKVKDGRSAVWTSEGQENNGARQEGITFFVMSKRVEFPKRNE